MTAVPAVAAARWLAGALGGHCEVCHGWTDLGLCRPCRQRFAAPRPRCETCAIEVPAGVSRCGQCLADPPAFARTVCLADYAFPWNRLITRLKFQQTPELAPLLADVLLAAARQAEAPLAQAFVPVPLSDQRLAVRGYDQAWELARQLARATQRPAHARALQRRFDSQRQMQLDRQHRLRNLRGAFIVPPPMRPRVQGRHLALVDDVMTTGATAQEAAAVLLAAGAVRVDLWIVARTPAPGRQPEG
jgi:ComF family protein